VTWLGHGSGRIRRRIEVISWLEWTLGFILLSLYITCIFTVCSLTFQKGHTILGIVGIFVPLLWLIGAILPAKPGSRYEVSQKMMYEQQVQAYS
jgi:hypothetical protein